MSTPFFVDAIEDAVVLRIDLASFNALIAAIPDLGHAYRLGLERSEAAKQRRLALLLHASENTESNSNQNNERTRGP